MRRAVMEEWSGGVRGMGRGEPEPESDGAAVAGGLSPARHRLRG